MAEPRAAATVMERCYTLGGLSEEPDLLVQPYGSEALRRANDLVAGWMRAAGMTVRQDGFGNLIGRYEGRERGGGTLVLGSHLDTVRDAGRYDGPLGVLVGLACVESLRERDETPCAPPPSSCWPRRRRLWANPGWSRPWARSRSTPARAT